MRALLFQFSRSVSRGLQWPRYRKQPVHVCSTPTFLSQPRLKICTMTTGGKGKKTADSVNISQFSSSRRVHSAVATTSSRFLFCVFASVVFRMSRFSHSFAAFLHPLARLGSCCGVPRPSCGRTRNGINNMSSVVVRREIEAGCLEP